MARLIAVLSVVAVLVMSCGNGPEVEPATPHEETQEIQEAPVIVSAAVVSDSLSRQAHARIVSEFAGESYPLGQLIQEIAEDLIGSPYVDYMLDQTEEETLIVNLTEFDCVLFVEVVVALAQALEVGISDFDTFAGNVERLRYREGTMSNYCSRLHYFTDWLYDNDRRGTIHLFTSELSAATPFDKEINFMSGHRESYPRLVGNDEAFMCIGEREQELNTRSFHYIPEARIADVYDDLQAGDIVALTTGIEGLDIAHTGFIYKHADGGTGFIHASTTGQVRLEQDLALYVQGIRNQNGMMVARAQPVFQ